MKDKIKSIKRPHLKIPEVNFGLIFTLVKKELFNFFSTPLAYIIIALFVIVLMILFFAVGKFLQVGTTDLSNLFSYISFTFVIIVPAITMSSISREKVSGTIEYLLTQPITEFQLLISKFIAYSLFIAILLIFTLPLVITIGTFGQLDIGQVIMQYVGALVLGMSLVSVGLAVSSLLKSEIAAFLTTLVIAALFIILGSDLLQLNLGIDFIIERIGLLSHYQSISRGVLDLRDLLYFIAFITAFLSIAYYLIIKDKFPSRNRNLQYARVSLVIIIVITLLIGYIGQVIPGRIDFTSNKIYTLSDASVDVVNKVSDVLNITLYASNNLPIEFQSQVRDVQDLLRDYQTYSSGKISYQFKQPDSSDSNNEASTAGLSPIRFQVNNSDSSQVAIGYFGIGFKYLDKTESLDLNDQSIFNNLEYEITKKINKLANNDLKTIGFLTTNVAYTPDSQNMKSFTNEINELFNVQQVDLSKDIPKEITTLVIDGPNAKFNDTEIKKIKDFYSNGGNVFLLTNPVTVDSQSFTASNNDNSLRDLFADYGVTVNQNLVYDLQNNNLVNTGYLFPINYPLWVVAQSTNADISVLKDVKEVSYLWGSSISINTSKTSNEAVYKLIETSGSANVQVSGSYNLAPDQTWNAKQDDSIQLLAVALQNNNNGKAVIVGDSKLISDDYNLSTLSENMAFGLGSIEWLSGADAIASIQAKVRTAPKLSLSSPQTTTLSVAGIGFPIAAIVVFGVLRFYLRRKRQERKYKLA